MIHWIGLSNKLTIQLNYLIMVLNYCICILPVPYRVAYRGSIIQYQSTGGIRMPVVAHCAVRYESLVSVWGSRVLRLALGRKEEGQNGDCGQGGCGEGRVPRGRAHARPNGRPLKLHPALRGGARRMEARPRGSASRRPRGPMAEAWGGGPRAPWARTPWRPMREGRRPACLSAGPTAPRMGRQEAGAQGPGAPRRRGEGGLQAERPAGIYREDEGVHTDPMRRGRREGRACEAPPGAKPPSFSLPFPCRPPS